VQHYFVGETRLVGCSKEEGQGVVCLLKGKRLHRRRTQVLGVDQREHVGKVVQELANASGRDDPRLLVDAAERGPSLPQLVGQGRIHLQMVTRRQPPAAHPQARHDRMVAVAVAVAAVAAQVEHGVHAHSARGIEHTLDQIDLADVDQRARFERPRNQEVPLARALDRDERRQLPVRQQLCCRVRRLLRAQ